MTNLLLTVQDGNKTVNSLDNSLIPDSVTWISMVLRSFTNYTALVWQNNTPSVLYGNIYYLYWKAWLFSEQLKLFLPEHPKSDVLSRSQTASFSVLFNNPDFSFPVWNYIYTIYIYIMYIIYRIYTRQCLPGYFFLTDTWPQAWFCGPLGYSSWQSHRLPSCRPYCRSAC